MKTIVCFGDANAWGADPLQESRFNRLQRWPGILIRIFGDQYWVIEEGMCGRTTLYEDPVEEYNAVGIILSLVFSRIRRWIL
jgi:hypothetical protein